MKIKKKVGKGRFNTLISEPLWQNRSIFQRIVIICVSLVFIIYIQGIAIASWYIDKHRKEPLNFGVTFIAEYAQHLGVDPQQTFKALRDDMGFRRFRLVTYWNQVEPTKGNFDFSDIDWQLKMIEQVGGSATVSIGLRQPRWPECHFAPWATNEPVDQRNSDVDNFISKTVAHLKEYKVVTSYQLENEYFLNFFGECPPANRHQLTNEYALVKKADPTKPVLLSLANNYFGVPTGQPRPDEFAVSVYTRVWDSLFTHRYVQYPFTPNYFAYRAGLTEIFTGRESMLHELQVEPWAPNGHDITEISNAEQDKTMSAKRAASQVQYAIDTGFRDIDLWGGEWWYWRMADKHDPSIWNAVKGALETAREKYHAN